MRVIHIDVDSLRPDHTEPYGYRRKITPNLQEFARDAVVFDRYYCSDSPCMPSRARSKGPKSGGHSHLILSHGAHSYQLAVRTRDHLYVRTLHPGCFRAEWEQLYNVTEDPYLIRNVLAESSGVADQAKELLSDWWYQHAGFLGAFPDPMQTTLDVGPTFQFEPAAYIEHLRDTGRKDFAADLQVRLGRSRSGVYRG